MRHWGVSRLELTVAAATTVLATGCTKHEALDLLDASWVDDSRIRLTFTDEVADVGETDPGKFRISAGGYYLDGTGTWYMDLGAYDDPPRRTGVTALENDGGDAVVLTLDGSNVSACDKMEEWLEDPEFANVAFYPTYAAGGGPGLEDLDGNRLASIAPAWVASDEEYLVLEGRFENMVPTIPFDCPR